MINFLKQLLFYLSMEEQNTTSWSYKIKSFIQEAIRVLRVTKKPDAAEFKTTLKVSGLGILIIGLLGFLVQMIKLLFF